MKTDQLLLTGLDITEDEYSFKGQFILKASGKSRQVDLVELEKRPQLEELKIYFGLDESISDIRNKLMDMVIEKAHIGSKIVEGENYEETSKKKKVERSARSLDMA